jgi:large subunit ribosomal protein L31
MKAKIHPKYEAVTLTCTCGNVIETRSTNFTDKHLDICSNCHPFYTGKQKLIDSAGRIEKFRKKFSKENIQAKTKSAKKSKTKVAKTDS